VNASVYHQSATFARGAADLHTAQRIARVDADADDVAGLNGIEVHLLQRFVRNNGVAAAKRCGARENIKPARGDYPDSERGVAGVNQMNAHR
jgi:hypothetical protein